MTGGVPITLASASVARRALLAGAGVAADAVASGVDEDAAKAALLAADASPRHVAEVLAAAKAEAVSRTRPGLVIGADQTLDLDGALLDKAADLEEAKARVLSLRGQPHRLHAAIAVAEAGVVVWTHVETATLHVRDFSDAWLDAYVAAEGEALLGSVGCYRLEGFGVQLFDRIDGDYFTILGLPLPPLLGWLRGRGALDS